MQLFWKIITNCRSRMYFRSWPMYYKQVCTILLVLATLNELIADVRAAENSREYLLPKSSSKLYSFKHAAISSDSKVCSEIGTKILEDGGNVVDSAVASLFCNGIATMESQGIGGGFIMNLFIDGKAYTLNAKEVAPINVRNKTFKTTDEYQYGPLAICTPGEIKGYWEVHKRFGSMKWKDLIQPTIELCERGTELTEHMRYGLELQNNINDTHLRKTFINSTTGEIYAIGTHVYPPQQLCDTFKIIAANGGEDFYTGYLADLITEDLQDIGSLITKQDLQEYKTVWSDSIPIQLNKSTMYITPAPTGGAIIALILNILKGYKFSPDSISTDEKKLLTYHRILESFKFAFGQRSKIGDPDYVHEVKELYNNLTSTSYAEALRQQIDDDRTYTDPLHYGAEYETSADHGTSHMSILAPNGDAIAVTSSVNYYFGIGQVGKRTGIVFNTGLSDFGVPPFKNLYDISPSPANYLAPKKHALSSMSPIIVTDENNNLVLVIGAAGGVRIITGISWTILRTLWFQQNIKEAIDLPRVYHQLEPNVVEYEFGTPETLINGLHKLGHSTTLFKERGAIVNVILNETGIYANADFRKKGDAAGF